MQPVRDISWILPNDLSIAALEQLLAVAFSLHHTLETETTRLWFDTFDWRLYRKKQILSYENNTWFLTDFKDRPLRSLPNSPEDLRLAQQFPESSLGTTLKKSLAVRALLQTGSAKIHTLCLQIRNKKGKRSSDLILQKITNVRSGTQLTLLHSKALRGDLKWFKRLEGILHDCGAVQTKKMAKTTLNLAMEGGSRAPLDFSSGFHVKLSREMKSSAAVVQIHTALRTAIQQNRKGVLNDTDPEFLHDMRVAIRRTRSALSQIKGVLSEEVSAFLMEEFRYLGQITGPVRDLDVYLLNKEQYSRQLPAALRPGLAPFFKTLALRRSKEFNTLVTLLRGPRFQGILTEWPYLLEESHTTSPERKSATPIAPLAGRIIHKRFRRILRDGRKINSETRDSDLHRLRIQCKKLRYSLEFFASLYDPDQIKQFIRQLKMLQNNLGDFNDLSIQQEMLFAYLSEIRGGGREKQNTAAAIGGLITELSRQHQWLRAHFEETFGHFCRPENMALYHTIFG